MSKRTKDPPLAHPRLRLALLTTDNREHYRRYSSATPFFGSAPEALLEGFARHSPEIEVHIISCLQKAVDQRDQKLAENIFYHALHVPKLGWMRTCYQGCVRAVRRKLREIEPAIVHGQGTERDCSIAAVLSGYPNVLTIHGHMGRIAEEIRAKPLTYYWLAARLERWCIRRTAGVVAISAYTKQRIAAVARRTWLVPNAVQGAFFDVQHTETERATLLCVAHVNPWKNQIGLIEALEPLRNERQFTLLFVGAADGRDAYSGKFLDMVAKREWCSHAGQLSRNQLLEELARCKAVILPSFEDNCPMVVLEAAAAAVPVAASSVGGIPDLISEGKTGRLFDPHDPSSIQKAVLKILDDKLGTLTMAQRAKEICLARHSPHVVAAEHLKIYREIVGLAQR